MTDDTPRTILLEGEIDMATAPFLGDALSEALDSAEGVVVDMAGVTFIDSTGLHALVQAALSMNGAGPLVLAHVPPGVQRVLKIVGMDELPCLQIREEA